jgi:hypothetical protein
MPDERATAEQIANLRTRIEALEAVNAEQLNTRRERREAAERGLLDNMFLRDARVVVTLPDGTEKRGVVADHRDGLPWRINVVFDDAPHTVHGWVDLLKHDVRREDPTDA